MAVTLGELINASSEREVRPSKGKINDQKVARNKTLLEALAKGGSVTSYVAKDGTVKMKIVVRKQDLEQLMDAMNVTADNNGSTLPSLAPSSNIERRLYDLMRRKRTNKAKGHLSSSWRPALQSIPEEH